MRARLFGEIMEEKEIRHHRRALLHAMLLLASTSAYAQTALPEGEHKNQARISDDALSLGGKPIGANAQPAETLTYIYADPQGTPLAEADSNGNITATFDYRAYGRVSMGSAPNGPGYTGHVNDQDTGLSYMQARYYDPEIGRFISIDLVMPLAGGISEFNRYFYASGNPFLNQDPTGMAPAASPLLQMKFWRNAIWEVAGEAMVKIGIAFKDTSDRTSIVATASAGNGLAGASASKGLMNAQDQIAFVAGGAAGRSVSIDVKYKLFSLNIPALTRDSKFSLTGHVEAHDVVGGAIEGVYDPNGTISAYISLGAGYGATASFGSVDYATSPTASDPYRNMSEEEKAAYQEKQVREGLGKGRPCDDYMYGCGGF